MRIKNIHSSNGLKVFSALVQVRRIQLAKSISRRHFSLMIKIVWGAIYPCPLLCKRSLFWISWMEGHLQHIRNCSSLSDKSFWDSNVASSSRGGGLWCSKELWLSMYHCLLELRINIILIRHCSSEDAARWVTHRLASVVWLSFILCFLCLDFFSAVFFLFVFDFMQSIPNECQQKYVTMCVPETAQEVSWMRK